MTHVYREPCILIGGAPRSGTTLVGQILASHPDAAILLEERLTDVVLAVERLCSIRTHNEEAVRTELFGGPRSFLRFPLWEAEVDIDALSRLRSYAKRFDKLFKATFEAVTERDNPKVIGSKLPIGRDWEDIDFLRSRIGDLRIILIVRNPLDVISSSLVRADNARQGLDEWPVQSVVEAYEQWRIAMVKMNELMCTIPHEQILLVKYEELCQAPEVEERRIRAFASLMSKTISSVSNLQKSCRSILSNQDLAFIADELGNVDEIWHRLTAGEAIKLYSGIVRHLPFGDSSLAEGAYGWVLTSGFSGVEEWGRWTDGPSAVLQFRPPKPVSAARLSLDVAMARVPAGRTDAPLTIRINGGAPQLGLAKAGERLNIDLSEDHVNAEMLQVEIQILEPKPHGEHPAHDLRQLGIALTGLSLNPI